jgi:transcription initiation factor TFIIIB Brf1 subunit/transcription initiation factor TFIIB
MAKEFYDFIFAKKRDEKVLMDVKQFCLDTGLLSGHSPKCIEASLYYLKFFGGEDLTQLDVAERFGISCVSLRNNVKKIRASEHWAVIKVMLSATNVDRKV